jgi:hypothetical protein
VCTEGSEEAFFKKAERDKIKIKKNQKQKKIVGKQEAEARVHACSACARGGDVVG